MVETIGWNNHAQELECPPLGILPRPQRPGYWFQQITRSYDQSCMGEALNLKFHIRCAAIEGTPLNYVPRVKLAELRRQVDFHIRFRYMAPHLAWGYWTAFVSRYVNKLCHNRPYNRRYHRPSIESSI
jgi:hypothetical protein